MKKLQDNHFLKLNDAVKLSRQSKDKMKYAILNATTQRKFLTPKLLVSFLTITAIGICFMLIFTQNVDLKFSDRAIIDSNDHYSFIEEFVIKDILNDSNMEYVKFKGHGENWAAVYIAYKVRDNDKFSTDLYVKYIGEKPNPTGTIKYYYDAGSDTGSGSTTYEDEPENGIYLLGISGSFEPLPTKDYKMKLLIEWDKESELIELKSE